MFKVMEQVAEDKLAVELGVYSGYSTIQKKLSELAREKNCVLQLNGNQAKMMYKGKLLALYSIVPVIPVLRKAGIRNGILQEVVVKRPVMKLA